MGTDLSSGSCQQATKNKTYGGSGENVNTTANITSDNQSEKNVSNMENKQETKAEFNQDTIDKIDYSETKNDFSTLSTAFTISFDDDDSNSNSNKKLFGIRDSIRKFAPPKPNTIEKVRPNKNDSSNQDNSLMSIESAPGGYSKQSPSMLRRDKFNSSCRSSGRRSDSSRHLNISESAAFLIDKMLNNNKPGELLSSIYTNSPTSPKVKLAGGDGEKLSRGQTVSVSSCAGSGKVATKKHYSLLSRNGDEDNLENEIDYCEDRSDNGTYIVGEDPESDAARKRIDELFGVVKAAEASLVANASKTIIKQKARPPLATRPSRASEKRPAQQFDRERQEHINRLATGRHSSRSSSSSHQESREGHHRPRPSTKQQQRNSSCDRTYSKLPTSQHRSHRRATSQSSRQSSNRDPSEEADDPGSSRSSLHHQDASDMLLSNQENQAPYVMNPSMKFNRAFALRRARLGLGEPTRHGGGLQNNGQPTESDGRSNLMSSPKRVAGLAQYNKHQAPASPSRAAPQNLSRTDGGRFSLRMRNSIASRLTSGLRTSAQQHHGTAMIDSYSAKVCPNSSKSSAPKSSSSTIAMPYPSGDELDAALLSPRRSRQSVGGGGGCRSSAAATKSLQQAAVSYPRHDIAPEWELIDSDNRLNYSLGPDYFEASSSASFNSNEQRYNNRMCQSAVGSGGASGLAIGQQQPPLGALDCLVISAISSLSMKIRGSVCDLMVEHAKRLPSENETRLIVEEILPQLSANSARPKSPTSIEEIDQSVYFDLAQTLKNLKKLEQMVDVMKMISNQTPSSSLSPTGNNNLDNNSNNSNTASKSSSTSLSGGLQNSGLTTTGESTTARAGQRVTAATISNTNSEATSLSPV